MKLALLLKGASTLLVLLCFSCKKVLDRNANQPPIAHAGVDRAIIPPQDSVMLDGSASEDLDGSIISYQWEKIEGPASARISDQHAAKTTIEMLVSGNYSFELTVTDDGHLSAKDTVQILVSSASSYFCDVNRPQVPVQVTPIGTLSQPRGGMVAAAEGNKILFAGGGGTRVDIFDFVANTWSTAELSLKRDYIASIAAGGKIFFAGGQDDDGWSVKAVDIYDVTTNTWFVSQLNRGGDALTAATVGNKVFFAGGNLGIYAENKVDVYNLTTKTWSTAVLSQARNFITAVSADNKVYFTGGDPWAGSTSNVIDVYDNTTGVWSTSTMLLSRGYHSAIALNDILYFAGGRTSTSGQAMCSVETLNTKTGARAFMSLSRSLSGRNALAKDNKILFFRNDGTADSDKFDIYDPSSNKWSIGILPFRIGNASFIAFNNTVYIAGGTLNGILSNKVYILEF